MDKQKIILSVLGLAVVVVFGYLIIKKNHQAASVVVQPPTETPDQPVVTAPAPDKPVVKPVDHSINFGNDLVLKLHDKVTFPDGFSVTLKELRDSRCPAGVQCIWAGELGGIFTISGGSLSTTQDMYLGTASGKSSTIEAYTLTLKDETKTQATIEVTKK